MPRLGEYMGNSDAVVIGLPRGGMVTAALLAEKLKLSLDFIVVKKVGAPGNEEMAIGAVTENGEKYSDDRFIRAQKAASERSSLYRRDYPVGDLKDKIAIIVDDGIATGTTMLAAVAAARRRGARKVVVAVPVASSEAAEKIRRGADELICIETDSNMSAVGEYYGEFPQIEDDEVLTILRTARR